MEEKPPSAWPRADLAGIMPCAALAARLITAWLARQRGADRAWEEFRQTGANAWRLALRHVVGWGFGPWELRAVPVRRQPDCLVCGTGTASLAQVNQLLSGDLPC